MKAINSEEAAVKRELLIKTLSVFTGISHQAIANDVNSVRNDKYSERVEKLKVSAEQYLSSVNEDPDNITAHVANHESSIEKIEKEYKRNSVGVNYQLSRYEAIQETRRDADQDGASSTFVMNYFPAFQEALSGGMNWASGCLMYVGGRANSGKTATCIAIGCDIAMSDPNAMVLLHSTDDSYEQIEPRIKTNIYQMAHPTGKELSIGMVVQPHLYLHPLDEEYHAAYEEADNIFKEFKFLAIIRRPDVGLSSL